MSKKEKKVLKKKVLKKEVQEELPNLNEIYIYEKIGDEILIKTVDGEPLAKK